MTIFVEDKLKPGVVGINLADAVDIELTGGSNVQAQITSIDTSITTLNTNVATLGSLGIAWNFDSATTADPPNQTFRFNNADPFPATILYLDKSSLSGNFNEFLAAFASGGFIFLQDSTNTGNSFLFETTGTATDQSGPTGWFEFPVTLRRSQGSFTGVNGDRFEFTFIPATGTGGGTLPNMFLNEITTSEVSDFTRKIDTEAVVRFWLRTAVVAPGDVNNVGTGLRIDESNGDNGDNSDTFESSTSVNNAFIYVTLDDTFAGATDLNTVWLVRKNSEGKVIQEVNFGANFTSDAGLSGVVAGTAYVSSTGLSGNGPRINYFGGETLELFFRDTDNLFTISESNADNVDLTRSVKTLAESQLDDDLASKVNYLHTNRPKEQFVLDQFVDVSSSSSPGNLSGTTAFYFKDGAFSNESTDYFATTFDSGLPANLGSVSVTWTVAVPNAYDISSAAGSESGTGTATLVIKDILLSDLDTNFDVYTVTLPATASATNNFLLVGTLLTITELNPSSVVKIDRTNVEANFLTHIENDQGTGDTATRLAALENKVATLYALAPDVDALRNWGDIYIPERAVQEVVLTEGYTLVADYRGDATRFESTGVVYSDAGTNVVTYTGLSADLHRAFGFRVSGPANQTLLWVIDGSDRIPFLDVTSAGNYRINNYTPPQTATETVTNQIQFLSPQAGTTGVISTAMGSNVIYFIPDYPVGATNTSRSIQIGLDVLVNGQDTQGEHLMQIDVPETNVAQDRIQRTASIYLGPVYGNRTVDVTIDYRFTVPSEYRFIVTLQTAPSDVTLRVKDVAVTRSYTAPTTVARVDNFEILEDLNGDYTFTGENELLLVFHPIIPANGLMDVVPAAVVTATGVTTELNDRVVSIPDAGFEDVEIPDQTAFAGFQFRTFLPDHFLIHRDLSNTLRDRDVQWAYGLARLRTVSTAHAVSEKLDLASGSTIGGATITGRSWQNAQSFTAASSVTVTLPTSTTLGDFVLIEATWHTGVGTATDNDNRNYTELGSMSAILNATDAELVLGGRGRGAENFGIEVTTSGLASNDTTLTLGIINLNDAGGANLPTGSLITAVRFY